MMRFNNFYWLPILSILFISCELKFPEKWETPSWHLPINFPLQDETYFFGGLADSNTIFLDLDSTLIVLFEDSLSGPNGGRVGIDSTFNPYFRIEGLLSPDVEGIVIEPLNIEIFIPPIDSAIHLEVRKLDKDLKRKRMPNVVGMTARDALYVLENAGLKVKILGGGMIVNQSIEPGTLIYKGDKIFLTLS